MSTVNYLQKRISAACRITHERAVAEAKSQHDAQDAARRLGEAEPPLDLPRASSERWCRWAARILADHELEVWLRDADVSAAVEDLAGPVLAKLLSWPEFRCLEGVILELRWSTKPMVRKDVIVGMPQAGRPKVVPKADRLTWTGVGKAPSFRLELSLPFWLLATVEEKERGLHDVLSYLGFGENHTPKLRKPDIVAHAATLGRFGVAGLREASAVFHAQRHPDHERILREFRFDAVTGQGQLWTAAHHGQPSAQATTPRAKSQPASVEAEA